MTHAPNRPADEMISLVHAANFAGVSTRTLRRYISAGDLTGYRIGPRIIRVSRAELVALLHEIPTVKLAA